MSKEKVIKKESVHVPPIKEAGMGKVDWKAAREFLFI